MKRNIVFIALGYALVAGCNEKVELTPDVIGEGVYATLEQPDYIETKSLDYSDGKLTFSWANGDQLMVYGQSTSALLRVNEAVGTTANVTKLESPDFKLNEGATYYVFSPVEGTLSESTKEAVNVSFDNQRQVANGSTEHLKKTQYACATATVENNSVNFQLYNQVAWIRYSHEFAEGVTASKVVFSAEGVADAFVHSGTLNATSPVTDKGFITSITADSNSSSQYFDINLGEESSEGIAIASGETLEVFVAVHPVDLTDKTLKIQVLDKTGNELCSNEYAGRAIKRNAFVSFTDTSAKPTDVASVNGVGYGTLQEALSSCENGETVKLLKDVEAGMLQLFSENNAVLDLNGKNLITTGEIGFYLDGGKLTVKGDGVIGDSTQSKTSQLFVLGAYSTLNVEGNVTLYSEMECVFVDKIRSLMPVVNVNVSGGKWYGGEYNGTYWTINKHDETMCDVFINVTGGEFYKFNPAESHTENPVENWVPDGYGVIKEGDWYKVVKSIEVTDETSLKDAIKSSGIVSLAEGTNIALTSYLSIRKDGTSVFLDKDASLSSKGTDARAVISYLNGGGCIKGEGTIVAPDNHSQQVSSAIQFDSKYALVIDGDLTIKGGSSGCWNGDQYIKGISPAVLVYDGYVTINGGHFIGGIDRETGEAGPAVYAYASGTTYNARLDINGGLYESATDDASFLINKDDDSIGSVTIRIMGGTFVGFNPANNNADGEGTNYVPDGYVSTETTYNGKKAWVVTKQ